jgi:hypothetical protein
MGGQVEKMTEGYNNSIAKFESCLGYVGYIVGSLTFLGGSGFSGFQGFQGFRVFRVSGLERVFLTSVFTQTYTCS